MMSKYNIKYLLLLIFILITLSGCSSQTIDNKINDIQDFIEDVKSDFIEYYESLGIKEEKETNIIDVGRMPSNNMK